MAPLRTLAALMLAASGAPAAAQQAAPMPPPGHDCSGCTEAGGIESAWQGYFRTLAAEVHAHLNGADPAAAKLRADWLAAQPAGTPPAPLAIILAADATGRITLARPADPDDAATMREPLAAALLGKTVTPPPGTMRPVRIKLSLGAPNT